MTQQPDRRAMLRLVAGASALAGGMAPSAARGEDGAKPRIKLGQIGVGHAHASKLAVYRQSDDYEVVGIVEPDDDLRQRAASQDAYRDLPWMTEQQLLDTPGLQAVLVETRVRDALAAAEACVAAGKHVHLDKPAGQSLPRFRRLLDAAAEQELLVQMGYMYRYHPAILLLHEFLDRGWLGEVFEIQTVMSKTVAPADRADLAEYPGGIMFELGCHLVDLVVGVLGAPERVTPFAQRAAQRDDALVDNMLAVFEYPRALASIKSSALEVSGFARRHFTVCGTEGTFHIQPLDQPSARVAFSTDRDRYRRGYQELELPAYRRYVADAADMARIIRGEKPSDFPYDHDLAVQTAVLQASNLQQGVSP